MAELERQLAEQKNEHQVELTLKQREYRTAIAEVLGDNVNLDLQLTQVEAERDAFALENRSLAESNHFLESEKELYRQKYLRLADEVLELKRQLAVTTDRLQKRELEREAGVVIVPEPRICPTCQSINTSWNGATWYCHRCEEDYTPYTTDQA